MSDEIKQVLQERGKTHGDYKQNADFYDAVMSLYRATPNWDKLSTSMRLTLQMQVHKDARALTGNPFEVDHWVDKIGYNQLVVDELRNEKGVSVNSSEKEAQKQVPRFYDGQQVKFQDSPYRFIIDRVRVLENGVNVTLRRIVDDGHVLPASSN